MNLRVVMLTGDNAATARHMAGELHIDEVVSDVRPDEKEVRLYADDVLLNRTPPVSYTHLDVYKRQVWSLSGTARGNGFQQILPAQGRADGLGAVAVSYTHLDVYKRQVRMTASRGMAKTLSRTALSNTTRT